MARPRVVAFYGSKKRDSFNLTLLKYYLERLHGIDCALHRTDSEAFVFRVVRHHRPHAVVLLDAKFPSQIALIDEAERHGYAVVLLPTELQASHAAGRNAYVKQRERLARVRKFLSPGREPRQFLVEHGVFAERDVPVVGYSRYDSYAEPFAAELQLSREAFLAKYQLRGDRPIVVWASNNRLFAVTEAADPVAARAEMMRRYRETKFDEVHDLDRWIDAFVGSHQRSVEVVKDVVRRFGDGIQLLYRPRQGENVGRYDDTFRGVPGIRMVFDEYLGNLLAHADLVFHGFSLLGSEAWMFGKPTASYCFEGLDRYYFDGFKDCEDVVTTPGAVFDVLERLRAGGVRADAYRGAQQNFIETWYHRVDGLATARAAAIIAGVVRERAGTPRGPGLRATEAATTQLKRVLGLEEFESLRPSRTREIRARNLWIGRADVASWFTRFDRIFADERARARVRDVSGGLQA